MSVGADWHVGHHPRDCLVLVLCRETQTWLLEGSALKSPAFLRGSTAVVWARDYSTEDEARCDCPKLQQVLQVQRVHRV